MKQATVITPIVLFVLLVFSGGLYSETAQSSPRGRSANPPSSIEDHVSGMQKLDGFVPLYWDEQTGELWMEISRFDTEILYANGLTAGLGSNDIGLDRGQTGGSRIVSFERIGPKILMVQPNYNFRATSDNPAERRAFGSLGLHRCRRNWWARAGGRHRFLRSRRDQRGAATG